MKTAALIILLVFSSLSTSHAELNFVKKQVAFFKWGVGKNEFGQYFYREMRSGTGKRLKTKKRLFCPTAIDFDGVGNIYFADLPNERIDVLSSSGEMIRTVNLREREGGDLSVDENGEILTNHNRPDNNWASVPLLIKKDNKEIEYKGISGDFLEDGIIYDGKGNKIKQIGPGTKTGRSKHPVRLFYLKDYFLDSSRLKISLKLDGAKARFLKKYGKNLNGGTLDLVLPALDDWSGSRILGMDSSGDIYVMAEFFKHGAMNLELDKGFIFVFSIDGKLMGKIPLQLDLGGELSEESCKVDFSGNVYQIIGLKDGVHIIQWLKNIDK